MGSVEQSTKTVYDSAFPYAGGEDEGRVTSSPPGKSRRSKTDRVMTINP